MSKRALNVAQTELLRRIAASGVDGSTPNGDRVSARALAGRGLVRVVGRGANWRASATPAGIYYLETGDYPPEHHLAKRERLPVRTVDEAMRAQPLVAQASLSRSRDAQPVQDLVVDSPCGHRSRGKSVRSDALFNIQDPDPWDTKILVSVKEAAWMLSMTEPTIRDAVQRADLDRVYIGKGTTHYRIVYASLLEWVNSLPRESARRW